MPQVPDPDACAIVGDLNGDLVVNTTDVLILLSAWGPCNGLCPADLNKDTVVNTTDLLIMLSKWTGV